MIFILSLYLSKCVTIVERGSFLFAVFESKQSHYFCILLSSFVSWIWQGIKTLKDFHKTELKLKER